MKTNLEQPCPCEGGTLVRFIQPLILSLLTEDSSHGYLLLQKISQTRIWGDNPPDPSGVYRVLREMEKRGLVKSEISLESKAGLGRKVYSITPEGIECRKTWHNTLLNYRNDIDELVHMLENDN